jgi:hypothetical protein
MNSRTSFPRRRLLLSLPLALAALNVMRLTALAQSAPAAPPAPSERAAEDQRRLILSHRRRKAETKQQADEREATVLQDEAKPAPIATTSRKPLRKPNTIRVTRNSDTFDKKRAARHPSAVFRPVTASPDSDAPD